MTGGKKYFDGRAWLHTLERITDHRGVLSPFDFSAMPFEPSRTFVVSGSSANTVRGGHGHRQGQQMLVCLQGRIEVLMRTDGEEASTTLEPGLSGLVFGPGIWCQQTYQVAGSILLVFASDPYDATSYLRDPE
ncbi:FdtA/QdtA family cupin domain-containing protein [Halioglobus sp.]|nr:FdtA/QdtA family cupin domain-containing protein [Halioglobus sp.]